MSGWIARWSLVSTPADDPRWARAVALASRHGLPVNAVTTGAATIGAWRRETGEFPQSGLLHDAPGEAKVAWLGQCLEDDGDVSESAIACVASDATDADLARLNGPFAMAMAGCAPNRLVIAVDRHRHYPVYATHTPKAFVASTDWRLLTAWIDRPELDPVAVDLLLRCGEQIEGMTLLRGIEMLPAACVLRADAQGITRRQYWYMRHRPVLGPSPGALANEVGERLRNAVRRVERATDRLGITLSGGLDSRFLLGLCEAPARVPSFTWGLPGCRDIACAADFARRVGSPHTVRHWEPEAFPPAWADGVDATAGSVSVDNMYMLPFTAFLAEHCGVVLNGLAGDAILGGNFLTHAWLREDNLERLAYTAWRWRVPPHEDALVDALVPHCDGPRGEDLWVASILTESRERPVLRLNDWLYENRVFRNTNCGTMLLRRHVESHSPFFDRDVLDLLMTIPLEMRLKHRLYLPAMNRACPAAGAALWQRTALPPRWGYHANLASMAFHRGYGAVLQRLGQTPFPRLAVADPAGWMRGPWRPAVEAIVLSPRCLDRGVLAADVVKRVWRGHLDGANHTRMLGAMLSVELFARMAVDGDLPAEAVGVGERR